MIVGPLLGTLLTGLASVALLLAAAGMIRLSAPTFYAVSARRRASR